MKSADGAPIPSWTEAFSPIPGCSQSPTALGITLSGCQPQADSPVVNPIICQRFRRMDPCPAESTEPLRPRLLSSDGLLVVVYFPLTSQWIVTSSAGHGNAACITNRYLAVGNVTDPDDLGSPVVWGGFNSETGTFDKPAALNVQCD